MTSITVLNDDDYHAQIEKAENGEINASPEFCRKTNITPKDMIGNIVTFTSPRSNYSHTMGEVTDIDMKGKPEATISELFIDREFIETGHQLADGNKGAFINLSLPFLGDEHTVKWVEAKINDEWEMVSDVVLGTAMNHFTQIQHEYDTTRVLKKTYTHNPQGLCTNSIRPSDDQTRGEVIPDREQFTDPELYDQVMNSIIIPETVGKYTNLGTLYTLSDKRQHDGKRAHKIIDVRVDNIAKPDRKVSGRQSALNIDLSLAERVKYALGPNPREDMFGVDPTADNDNTEENREIA